MRFLGWKVLSNPIYLPDLEATNVRVSIARTFHNWKKIQNRDENDLSNLLEKTFNKRGVKNLLPRWDAAVENIFDK